MWQLYIISFFLGDSYALVKGVSHVQVIQMASKESCDAAAARLNEIRGRDSDGTTKKNTGNAIEAFCLENK